jgi:hypothetical protein
MIISLGWNFGNFILYGGLKELEKCLNAAKFAGRGLNTAIA